MITMHRSNAINLAQLSIALPLVAGLLGYEQKQKVENHKKSEFAFHSTSEARQLPQDMSPLRPDAGLIASSLETILARMSQATIQNQIHLRSYTVMREYELLGRKRDKPRSRVVASVTFRPLTSNSTIFKGARVMEWEKGIVRLALEREAALAKDGGVSDISEHNYNFLFLREEVTGKRRCHVLQLLPKRKDKNLLRGTIWVDAKTYVICRTDGEPAKSPSWWVRDVHIVLVYGDVGGMWLLKTSEYTAKVRLLGPSRMVERDLRYRYDQFALDNGSQLMEARCDGEIASVGGLNGFAIRPATTGSSTDRLTSSLSLVLDNLAEARIHTKSSARKVQQPAPPASGAVIG